MLETITSPSSGTPSLVKKINLLDLDRQEMKDFFLSLGEKAFRAEQVMKWIYHYSIDDFERMTNLNKNLRDRLKLCAEIIAPEVVAEQCASDGVIKWALAIDHQQIETVYIPERDRATLCVSSQVGCALGCTFCSTAQQGFNRNLRVSEIIGQVWRASQVLQKKGITGKRPITNVVMMGMGEPLLNISHVVPAMNIMLDDLGYGLSKRRVTLSTSGIVPALDKLSDLIDVALAISLHAPNDQIRNQLMPINLKYNIGQLLTSVKHYLNKSNANHGKVTIEYVLLEHINDEPAHAHELAKCLKDVPCKINLIPWNPYPNAPYRRSSNNRINQFTDILMQYGFIVVIRRTRGDDIDAACGQLAGDIIDRTKKSAKYSMIAESIPISHV